MSNTKTGQHHDHPDHKPGDVDQHGHGDTSGKKDVPGQHHDHPDHKPGDVDQHGHRDTSGKAGTK